MDLKLRGKGALISGSSSGIGEAIARALAAEGVRVVVHGRAREKAELVAAQIRAAGGEAHVAIGDLSQDSGAADVVRCTIDALGEAPDILINNAGGSGAAPQTWSSLLDTWHALFEQNFFSAIRLTLQLLPHMRERGWGRILNLGTGWSIAPSAQMPGYAAAKAALINVTVSLAQELAETGITVNSVSPGPVHTPQMEQVMRAVARERGWGDDWSEIEQHVARELIPTLVGRVGRPEEIAAAVVFLCSEHTGYQTGSHLRIDGGNIKSVI